MVVFVWYDVAVGFAVVGECYEVLVVVADEA